MGTGFWIVQAVFVAAAIITAICAEWERRHDEAPRDYPVVAWGPFTVVEEARLRQLRELVREARAGSGSLSDGLGPG